VLLIIGVIIKFIWWILGAVAIIGLIYLIRSLLRAQRRQRALLAKRNRDIAARADQQHNWVMQGDDRGIYGADGATLMHYIEQPERAAPPPVNQWVRGPFGTRFPRATR
jgi:hypothetical protein